MPLHVLSENEVWANLKIREYAKDFVQVLMRTKFHKSSDTKFLEKLNLRAPLNTHMYGWIDANITCTPSVVSTEAVLGDAN